MKTILCYGDSNTFGVNPDYDGTPDSPFRWPYDVRWPGVLAGLLGPDYHIIEEGLGGRTTAWEDQTVAGRNGLSSLLPVLQSHEPLDMVIIMLGTNDLKGVYQASVMEIGRGMDALLRVCLNPYTYDVPGVPKVLVVSPIHLGEGIGHSWLRGVFDAHSREKSMLLADELQSVAQRYGCLFYDAAKAASASEKDSVHMDASAHRKLAEALAPLVRESI